MLIISCVNSILAGGFEDGIKEYVSSSHTHITQTIFFPPTCLHSYSHHRQLSLTLRNIFPSSILWPHNTRWSSLGYTCQQLAWKGIGCKLDIPVSCDLSLAFMHEVFIHQARRKRQEGEQRELIEKRASSCFPSPASPRPQFLSASELI